jgi:RimJ/RimL family protein N-acetyltransferase
MHQIRALSELHSTAAWHFLARFEESSLFLINNLRNFGPRANDHFNSGNFKLVVDDEQNIVAIFCLTKRGNLLIQSAEEIDPDMILADCQQEAYPVTGLIGDWASVEPVYQAYGRRKSDFKPTLFSKEILFRLDLNFAPGDRDPRVRLLNADEFEAWFRLRKAFDRECGIPESLSEADYWREFKEATVNGSHWGLFENKELRSIAALNSESDSVGQVGGVFTPKSFRNRGYSQATMRTLLVDCQYKRQHHKSVLFTREDNVKAQSVYRALGYQSIGYFAIIMF